MRSKSQGIRTSNKMVLKTNKVNKIQVISVDKNAEILFINFCCRTKGVHFNDFFEYRKEQMKYWSHWEGIKRKCLISFNMGPLYITDIDYPELNRQKNSNSKYNKIVLDIAFVNKMGAKWKDVINQEEIKEFCDNCFDVIERENFKLNE